MIYYSILYPPLLPITIPAFELNQPSSSARWKLFFEPSIGNKISDFKGGFIRIRRAESEVSVFVQSTSADSYLYDLLPFRNPFAEYRDPYNSSLNELQPTGYPSGMPSVKFDTTANSYYIDIPHGVFSEARGHMNQRFKVQMMLTTDWIKSKNTNGSGTISYYNTDLQAYEAIDKNTYFSGNLVEKGLSEWSRVTLVSPVPKAEYNLMFKRFDTGENDGIGYLNSPIIEFIGERRNAKPTSGTDGNALKGYRISIYTSSEGKPDTLVDTSGWIIGQENPNLEIRWQNEIELEDKRYYFLKLEIQTVWDLRKEFIEECYSNFESSLFIGHVRAVNDHDNARVKIVITAQSPLTWGHASRTELDITNSGFIKMKGDVQVEQGIDLTTKNGSFAGEMVVANIEPIAHWEEDPARYFFRMSGPELSIHNPYQEEYLMYAHSTPISAVNESGIYEEDVLINPIMSSPTSTLSYETYMETNGEIATRPTESPVSHNYFFLKDPEDKTWRVTVADDGAFMTARAFEYDESTDEEMRPVYLYDKHFGYIRLLSIGTSGRLGLTGQAIKYNRDNSIKPMYVNEFRLVKRVWGLELGRKTLIGKQTYKSFFTDFNRKLGNWLPISPINQYYIYFASTKGQLFMYVKDLTAEDLNKNSIDRFNLMYAGMGIDLPQSGMFLQTNGIDAQFVPITDKEGNRISYTLTVDERGSLVSDVSYVGSSTTAHTPKRD